MTIMIYISCILLSFMSFALGVFAVIWMGDDFKMYIEYRKRVRETKKKIINELNTEYLSNKETRC